jgi:hypothetical protein
MMKESWKVEVEEEEEEGAVGDGKDEKEENTEFFLALNKQTNKKKIKRKNSQS